MSATPVINAQPFYARPALEQLESVDTPLFLAATERQNAAESVSDARVRIGVEAMLTQVAEAAGPYRTGADAFAVAVGDTNLAKRLSAHATALTHLKDIGTLTGPEVATELSGARSDAALATRLLDSIVHAG
jgi:hypothetical protein